MQMEIVSRKREGSITNLRAIAILMVVFGHSIILYSNNWNLYNTSWNVPFLNVLKECIDLIQMPLFFSISGYLFFYSYKTISFIDLVKKKFKRLLIPFISFSFLWLIPIRKLVRYTPYINKGIIDIFINYILLGKDNGHLWFLPCLFLCFILTYILFKILNKVEIFNKYRILISFVVSYLFAYYFYLFNNFIASEILKAVCMQWIWFVLGFNINSCKDYFKNKKRRDILLLAIISFFLILCSIMKVFPYKRITVIITLISIYLSIPKKAISIAEFLSKNSFGVYLFHSPLIYITFTLMANYYHL